jgi:hypothetical protein
MWRHADVASLLRNIDADRQLMSGGLARPVLALIANLSLAVRAARREDFSEGPWAFCQVGKSHLCLGISICIALHRLNHLNFKRVPPRRFGPVGQENPFAACAVPALVLAENEWDDPVPAIPIPLKLPGECAGDKVRDAERQAVDMHVRSQLTILILPGRGFECWEMWVGPKPVIMQGCRLMSD